MTRHTEKCSRFGLLVLTLHDLQDPSCFHRKKMIRDLSAVRVLQALEIFYLFSCELAVVTAHKSPKSDIADGHPFQFLDFIAYSGEHLADLSVLALVDADLHNGVARHLFYDSDLCRRSHEPADIDALAESGYAVVRDDS